MSRKKRDRQRREKKRYNTIKRKMREAWPALADALANPAAQDELEKNGLVADMEAIKKLASAGIFIAVAPDGRCRFSNLRRDA